MKKIKWLALGLALVFLTACGKPQSMRADREVFVLDTMVQFSVWTNENVDLSVAEKLLHEAEDLCRYYESTMSKTPETSDIYKLNHANGEPITVSPETAFLLEEAIRYSEMSEGYFDITILPIKDLWDFKAENPKVPPRAKIDDALQKVGYKNISLGEAAEYIDVKGEKKIGRKVVLKNGAQLDLGGIAKGYIADEVVRMLKESGIRKGIVNLGGNVLMIGEKEPGVPWRVGIQDPRSGRNDPIGSVGIVDRSVVTSGVYERFFEQDGKIYHHLLNPFQGVPADNGLASVTILTDRSVEGDALSTACFVLGKEKGLELAESIEGVEAIFITQDGDFFETSGVMDYDFKIE